MDLYDDETVPYVTAMLELPGVSREDISVVVRDGKLVVTGQRRSPLASRLRAINTQTSGETTGNASITTGATPAGAGASVETAEHGLNPVKYRTRELKFGKFHREIDIPDSTDVRLLSFPCNLPARA